MEGERFWERGSVIFHSRYDEGKVKSQLINGDGAKWIKQGKEYFPKQQSLKSSIKFCS